MNRVTNSIPQHLLELYHELSASRATLLALIESEGTGIHRRSLVQIDRMIAEIFFPVGFVVYQESEDLALAEAARPNQTGLAWCVISCERDVRVLLCHETKEENLLTIEQVITGYALVPNHLPELYQSVLELSPKHMEEKYCHLRGEHPFLNNYQWLQTVRHNQTQLGYWEWVRGELLTLRRDVIN